MNLFLQLAYLVLLLVNLRVKPTLMFLVQAEALNFVLFVTLILYLGLLGAGPSVLQALK
jgi:hypothetical protein